MSIKEADYNKALMTVRQAINNKEITGKTAGKSHPAHGGKDVPNGHGTELIAQVQADGGKPELIKKLKKIMGI